MLGHHYIANQLETVFLSNLIEDTDEHVARLRSTEERQPSVATEGDEVQVALAVNAFEPLGHDEKAPRSQTEHGAPATKPRELRIAMVSCCAKCPRANRPKEPGPPARVLKSCPRARHFPRIRRDGIPALDR
jgi:hypothetical protein